MLTLVVPKGTDREDAAQALARLVLALDALHRAHGGSGLRIEAQLGAAPARALPLAATRRRASPSSGAGEDHEHERPAPRRRKRQAKAGRSPRPGPAADPPPATSRDGGEGGEARELVEQLVARHRTVLATAAAVGVHPPQIRRWRKGQAATPASLERLRRTVAALADPALAGAPTDAGVGPTQEAPGCTRTGSRDFPVEDAATPPSPPPPTRSARELVAQLADRHGDIDGAAQATGFRPRQLEAWAEGAPAAPSALARLQKAADAPLAPEEEGGTPPPRAVREFR